MKLVIAEKPSVVLASGVNNLFPTGVMNHFLSETHSQF